MSGNAVNDTTLRQESEPADDRVVLEKGRRRTAADSWRVGPRESGRTLHLRVGDLLHVALPETPSTGFIWEVDDPAVVDRSKQLADPGIACALLERTIFEGANVEPSVDGGGTTQMLIGAGGVRHLTFRMLRTGRYALRLVKRRPWDTGDIADVFQVVLDISSAETSATATRS